MHEARSHPPPATFAGVRHVRAAPAQKEQGGLPPSVFVLQRATGAAQDADDAGQRGPSAARYRRLHGMARRAGAVTFRIRWRRTVQKNCLRDVGSLS
eukprot:scaffold368_cov258-Pinguiococcus_pyrenoidosus.AAC.75